MKLKKIVLDIVLSIFNFFIGFLKIDPKKIAFVSLESNELKDDMKMIYDRLKDKDYKLVTVLTSFKNNSLLMNFMYFLNTIKQIFVINTSRLVIISDNNYVISKFKREGVKVLEVWHASGAIKKFGNAIQRAYAIKNYDYVIANGEYWKKPYALAFGVKEEDVIITGMPRLDELFDKETLKEAKKKLLNKYGALKDKKVVLYAPTFRGNVLDGVTNVNIDLDKLLKQLGDDYAIVYKLHPLQENDYQGNNERIINVSHEKLYDLFALSNLLISDFSSIVLDYSLLDKPIFYYVPDLDDYLKDRGCFIDYQEEMKGFMAKEEKELADLILHNAHTNEIYLRNKFLDHRDGQNLRRVINLIEDIM